MLTELATAVHLAANTCTATALPAACQPSWLDTGSNSWQLTAATFVGLMSVPGLAVLYGGLVPKKWVVNTMFMAFSGFSAVLIVWVLWAYKMGFGSPDRRRHGEHLELHLRQQLLQELLRELRRASGDVAARHIRKSARRR